jgi:hypothetical protein
MHIDNKHAKTNQSYALLLWKFFPIVYFTKYGWYAHSAVNQSVKSANV